MEASLDDPLDVCIIGAGVAGACTAHLLRAHGARVLVVDPHARGPSLFRVEKLTADQLAYLERFGLLSRVADIGRHVQRITVGRRGRVSEVRPATEWCFRYQTLVTALRAGLDLLVAHVAQVALSDELQVVTMADGRAVRARLVVLASGASAALHRALSIARITLSPAHSMAFGFSLRPAGGVFPFQELTYFPERFGTRVDYITLFPIVGDTRANLFTYHDSRAPIVAAMKHTPDEMLRTLFPRLHRVSGAFSVVKPVHAVPMDLWVARPEGRPGLAVIGDAYQSACPATGRGCTKALNDAEVLASLAPGWLQTPGMPAAKVDTLYRDARKLEVDDESLRIARYLRRLRTDTGLRMRVHRAKEAVKRALVTRRPAAAASAW